MPVEKLTVKEGDKTQDIFIAMTPEEARDKSYKDYLRESEVVKTKEELRKTPNRPPPKYSKDHVAGAIRELNESREWHRKNPNAKRYH